MLLVGRHTVKFVPQVLIEGEQLAVVCCIHLLLFLRVVGCITFLAAGGRLCEALLATNRR